MFLNRNAGKFLFCLSLAVILCFNGTSDAADKKKASSKGTGVTSVSNAPAVAKVNGTVITKVEFERAMKVMLAQTGAPSSLTSDQKKSAETAVLNQLVSAELLFQEARKLEIKDIEKLVTKKIDDAKAKFSSPAQFYKSLSDNGITENELKDYARKEIYINNLIEVRIASKVVVTDDEERRFYDENPDMFKMPESVRASHILIGFDPKASDAERNLAREKAETILKKVRGGADFSTAAKENSTCPSSKQGGDLGFFTRGQMVLPFENVAFKLNIGEVSDVVETQFGYHIIKVLEKQPARSIFFDEVRKKVHDYLTSQKIREGITDYVEKLRKDGKVEILAS